MKTALIGYGYWGPNLLRNVASLTGVDIQYICDKDEKRLFEAVSKYPGAKTVKDANIVFEDEKVKSVILATGVSTHYTLAKEALKWGKDVFVEKPMTTSYKDAKELVALAKEKSKILMVGHTFLYSPPVLKIKEILDSGELGDIYFITSQRVNLGKHQKDTSVIWDLAPHDLSIFNFWLGTKPVVIGSFGNSYIIKGVPDVAFIHLKYPEDICVNLEIGWLAPSKLRHTAIVGSKKMLVYNDLDYEEKVKIFDIGVDYKDPETYGEFQLSYRTGDIYSPYISSKEPLFLEMKDFFNSITERRQPVSSCEFALDIVRICEDVENIMNNNRG